MEVPADPSSAAFLVAAALLAGRTLRVLGISLNPTRAGWLEVLEEMGARVRAVPIGEAAGEPVGDLVVEPGELVAFEVGGHRVPRLLDEGPARAVLAARARGVSRLRGAAGLRVKESDRLALLARNLEALGVPCRELPDGLEVEGTTGRLEGRVVTGGDHRIAMAFEALGRGPDCRIEVGADVHSKPSIRDYRKRILDRLGGKDELVLPATEDKPIDQQVFFTDVERARAERASLLVTDEGETVEYAAREYDVPVESVREALPVAKHGAILIRDDGYGLEAAADEVGTEPDRIREVLPDEVIEDAAGRDGRDERELQEDDVDDRDGEVRKLDRAERGDPLDDAETGFGVDRSAGAE
jgi:hypothetical protein